MKRSEALNILMLMAAMEAWAMCQKERPTDYPWDRLSDAIQVMRIEVMRLMEQEDAA